MTIAHRSAALLVAAGALAGADWSPRAGTLSADPQGWAYSPRIAAADDGTLYATWSQHRRPDVWEHLSPYAAVWRDGDWQVLGGAIEDGSVSGHDPQIAVMGGTPYVAWYAGWGWGWGQIGSTFYPTSIMVAHWNGTAWVRDPGPQANGGLDTMPTSDGWSVYAHDPRIAVVDGRLVAAWIESRPGDYGAMGYDVCVVAHLDAGTWSYDGAPFHASDAAGAKITDLAVADVGGVAHVAWSEFTRTTAASGNEIDAPGTVQVARLVGGSWQVLGATISTPGAWSNHLALSAAGGAPYVAWQEREAAGPQRLRVAHWDGAAWTRDGDALNVAADGEAGRPSLSGDGATLWLAWAEGAAGAPSQVRVRSLTGGTWSAPDAALNRSADGSAEHPALAIANHTPFAAWAEHDLATRTKQVYVDGRDAGGVGGGRAAAAFGADGAAPVIPDNTWVALHPGGVARTDWGVGDEGYDSFGYDPVTRRALVYGLYHSIAVSWGENQNMLLGYDFARNRWDMLEAGDTSWSEDFPACGHDEGNAVIDGVHGLYITHGNISVGSEYRYFLYAYDLAARRGKRMMPPTDLPGPRSDQMATAYDPDHDIVLFGTSWIYERAANTFTAIANPPAPRGSPCLVWDAKHHVFVMYGGGVGGYATPFAQETWILDPATRLWTQKSPARTPPTYPYPTYPSMAYDAANGVSLLIGGAANEAWVYDAGADAWTRIADLPASAPVSGTDGAYLTYDSDDGVFLVRGAADIADLWAFRYVPSSAGGDDTPPVIGAVTVSVDATTATIAWTTNEPADGQVTYGVDASLGSATPVAAAATTTHAITLAGLSPATSYAYRVASRDAAGNAAQSALAWFTTASAGGTTTGGSTTGGTIAGGTATGGTTTGGATTGGGHHGGCGFGAGSGVALALALRRLRA